jgi:hypothetical protein
MVQWAEKSSYVWEAVKENRLLQEAALGLIQAFVPLQDTSTLAVFNSLGHLRSGLVEVYIDHEIIPPGRDFRLRDAATGAEVPAQRSRSRADGTYWFIRAEDVPAMGFRTYRIETLQTTRPVERSLKISGSIEGDSERSITLENTFYRLVVDLDRGGITSLIDKELDRELVDGTCPWILGQFILERISNRGQLERFRLVDQERLSISDVAYGDSGGRNAPQMRAAPLPSGKAPGAALLAGQEGHRGPRGPLHRISLRHGKRTAPLRDSGR